MKKIETEPRFENACYLLERIDVSLDEFRYLANIENRDNRTRLIEDFYSIISNTESAQIRKLYRRCLEFTFTCSDKKIEEILLILRLYLSADPIDFDKTECKGLVTPIWQRLYKNRGVDIKRYSNICDHFISSRNQHVRNNVSDSISYA